MPLTKREAEKRIKKKGGHLQRHGAEHDYWFVNGRIVSIPRHAGDLSPGVEKDIKRALGE